MINSTCIIIDDEIDGLFNIRRLLKQFFPSITILKEETNADEAIKSVNRLKPDIIFLDIRLGNKTGFELIDGLNAQPLIIYTTAYDTYAIEAVSTEAVDYLLKPINSTKFQKAVSRALKILAEHTSTTHLKEGFNAISIPSKNRIKLVETHKIVRCEASSNYTIFYLVNGENYTVAKTLKESESELNTTNFVRVHQSHLVNLHYVDSYDISESTIQLFDGTQLVVSRSKRAITKKHISQLNVT